MQEYVSTTIEPIMMYGLLKSLWHYENYQIQIKNTRNRVTMEKGWKKAHNLDQVTGMCMSFIIRYNKR